VRGVRGRSLPEPHGTAPRVRQVSAATAGLLGAAGDRWLPPPSPSPLLLHCNASHCVMHRRILAHRVTLRDVSRDASQRVTHRVTHRGWQVRRGPWRVHLRGGLRLRPLDMNIFDVLSEAGGDVTIRRRLLRFLGQGWRLHPQGVVLLVVFHLFTAQRVRQAKTTSVKKMLCVEPIKAATEKRTKTRKLYSS
jgi:hypothetical protein